MKRLLILACSQRKRKSIEPLPAIERYNGPSFQLLRRFLNAPTPKRSVDICILSAKFGLITDDTIIPYYDQKMAHSRAAALRPFVFSRLQQIVKSQTYDSLFISAGQVYLNALQDIEKVVPSHINVKFASGSMGKHLSELHDWLYDEIPGKMVLSQDPKNTVHLRGREIGLTSLQVYETARNAFVRDGAKASTYQSWYVAVDDKRVAPKWLVSQLTGLPVGKFHTDEARRVLEELGVEVLRA